MTPFMNVLLLTWYVSPYIKSKTVAGGWVTMKTNKTWTQDKKSKTLRERLIKNKENINFNIIFLKSFNLKIAPFKDILKNCPHFDWVALNDSTLMITPSGGQKNHLVLYN